MSNDIRLRCGAALVAATAFCGPVNAHGAEPEAVIVAADEVADSASLPVSGVRPAVSGARPGLKPDPFTEQGALGHFTWGVDIGSSVDLTAHDMTGFNMAACVGYKGRWLRFAGVGAEVTSVMNNSSRLCPVYVMARSSFSPYHRLCFMELRAGVSFSSVMELPTQTDFYGSAGVGLTLAHSRKFTSHVVLRGTVIPLRPVTDDMGRKHLNYVLAYACIGLGCAF